MSLLASAAPAFGQTEEPISPLPAVAADLDVHKVKLGQDLFSDKRLSFNGTKSCASCHDLAKGGEDGLARSPNAAGGLTAVHTPTIFNSVLNFRQFWDGRAETVQAQIDDSVQSPLSLNNTWPALLTTLSADAGLTRRFKASYPAGLTRESVVDALVAYERSLLTPNSRFDQYLRGDKTALTAEEAEGYTLFKSYGCVSCHQGENIGGNMFQAFGVVGPKGAYFAERGHPSAADNGRFNVTGEEDDRYVFKVPSLRNVALRAPYFHDGSAAHLADAVDVMFKYQLGRTASAQDVSLIVKFLDTLTGEYDGHSLSADDSTISDLGH